MVLAIDTIDGRGLSYEARRVLPKEEQGNAVFSVRYMHSKSRLTSCTILTRRSSSVLKVGVPCGCYSIIIIYPITVQTSQAKTMHRRKRYIHIQYTEFNHIII